MSAQVIDPAICPHCLKDSCAGDCCVRRLAFESLGEFLARVESLPAPSWRVGDLLPDEGLAVWHGRPRSMKSLCALEVLMAQATGTPAFGTERFETTPPEGSLLYLTEEDGERLLAFRLRLLLEGRRLTAPPSLLKLLVRPGWCLEAPADQAAILDAIRETKPAPVVLCIDPVRASLPSIDKGPADAACAIRFLRRVQRDTTVRTILLPHHDTKPRADGKEDRTRPERASGGAVFSVAEAPVNFERVDDRTCYAVPSHYKLGSDPKPFRVHFESSTPPGEPFAGWLRAVAETSTEAEEQATRADGKVLDALRTADEWRKTAEITEAVKARKADVLDALGRLFKVDKVARREDGKGYAWRLALGVE